MSETELKIFLETTFEKQESELCYRANVAEFAFETDIKNQTKEQIRTNLTLEIAKHNKEVWKNYFRDVTPEMYTDEILRREVKFAHILGNSALDENKLAEVSNYSKI